MCSSPLIPTVPYDESWSSDSSFSRFPWTGQPLNYTALSGFVNWGPLVHDLSSYDSDNPGHYPLYDLASLNGTPLPLSMNSTITFTINYFEFECPSMSQYWIGDPWMSELGNDSIYAKNTSILISQEGLGSGFFLDTNFTFTSQLGLDNVQSVAFGSFQGSGITIWSCVIYSVTRNITIIHQDIIVPSDISNGRSGVDIMQSVGPATISSTTPFTNQTLAAQLFMHWPGIDPGSLNTSSLTENYIARDSIASQRVVDLSNIDNITFATRLTSVFNTYIQLLPLGTDPEYTGSPGGLTSVSSTPLQFFPFTIESCNWTWFMILTLASTFLLFCSCLSSWLTLRLSTPDLLGYVSSSTIENPHMYISNEDFGLKSDMDGLVRSKKLRNVRVQIRDVQEGEKVGKIALTSDVREQQKTKWGRKFV